MSVVVEIDIPPDSFLLGETMTRFPDIEVEVVRMVTGVSTVTPFIWAYGRRLDSFTEALPRDASVKEAVLLDERRITDPDQDEHIHEGLFRVRWTDKRPPFVAAIADHNGAVLHASYNGTSDWELTVLLPKRDSLSALHDEARDLDAGLNLRRVNGGYQPSECGTYGVTQEQYEALVAAYRAGYFEIPREQTLSEIASELDISANAMSARLRRGYRCLLVNTIIEDE